MSVYENVPLVELESELRRYALSWPTIVIAGVALRDHSRLCSMLCSLGILMRLAVCPTCGLVESGSYRGITVVHR